MSRLPYKESLYYLVKTEDKFIKTISNKIYTDDNIRVVQIIGRSKDGLLIVKGSKTSTCFSIDINVFTDVVDIVSCMTIIAN